MSLAVFDYLGGANYGSKILGNHVKGAGARFIFNTQRPHWPKTDAFVVLDTLAKSGLAPMLGGHGYWHDDHLYIPKEQDTIIFDALERVNQLAQTYPNIEWVFSPVCELSTRGAIVDTLWKRLHAHKSPEVTLVNSVYNGSYRDGEVNEFHGSKRPPLNGRWGYSYDGQNCWDQNHIKLCKDFKAAWYIALWVCLFNGKWNDKSSDQEGADTTPRPLRKAWPYKQVFPMLQAHSQVIEGTLPEISGIKCSVRHIWKSQADQHGPVPQSREGKPVYICHPNGAECVVKAMNGTKIISMPRDGNYVDGRPKYRSELFGYQIANRAMKLCNSPLVQTFIGGKRIDTVHPALRAGTFQR